MALFLKHIPTGDLYPFNDLMEKRGDMLRVEIEPVVEVAEPKKRRATKIDAMAADGVEVGSPE